MTAESKRITLVVFCLTAAAVALIAAALPQLTFAPGIPLPSQLNSPAVAEEEPMPTVSISIGTVLKTVLEIVLAAAAVVVAYKMRKQIPWREILPSMLFIAAMGLIGLFILYLLQNVHIDADLRAPEIVPPEVNITGPDLGPVDPNLIGLVWIALAAAVILAGVGLYVWSVRRVRRGDPVLREAERAINELKAGADIRSVIVRCYYQMSRALQKERGIELEQTMTARDFESLLEARGVPGEPVHDLTRLFEGARYGRRQSGPDEERKAMDCLSAIVRYSRGSGQPE
jgi:hypothetical protein